MKVSDSQWHKQLSELAATEPVDGENPYWLGPFENYNTFCPYLVGSYDAVSAEVARYIGLGFKTFILDIPAVGRRAPAHGGRLRARQGARVAVTLLQDYVTRQAEARPDAVALVMGDERLTYGELEEAGNRLARLLRRGGLRARRSRLPVRAEMPGGDRRELGVLKADCAYVPIDIASPAPRVENDRRVVGARA